MQNDDLLRAENHFAFGKNWSEYASLIDEQSIRAAVDGVRRLVPEEAIAGARWLDIGSGSGLHTLAAARLGARELTSIDIDKDSVATTRRVLAAHDVKARVEECSVFQSDHLGQFDVVYSWGVLHHTGDMWRAIDCASHRVAPGGWLAIALYQETPLCGAWKIEKALYTKAPEAVRKLARGLYKAAFKLDLRRRGSNLAAYTASYSTKRGMSFDHDVHDWLGGYPYESATPEETRDYLVQRGFHPVMIGDLKPGLGFFGTGCAEFVFRKSK